MPTYTYEIITTGDRVETEQRITEKAHTHKGGDRFYCLPTYADEIVVAEDHDPNAAVGELLMPVKRLISGAPAAFLVDGPSGGWASTGYSKRPHERKAEAILGRPLVKAAR